MRQQRAKLTPLAFSVASPTVELYPVQKKSSVLPESLAPKQQILANLRDIEIQAAKINKLSAELEQALWELKTLAIKVSYQSQISKDKPLSRQSTPVCEYLTTNLPVIKQKPSGGFIVGSRAVDLGKAEREANFLAQQLRQWANRRRN